jgi:sorting nexin-8
LHKGHIHSVTNGASTASLPVPTAAATQRTTSSFTTHSDAPGHSETRSPAPSRQASTGSDSWGGGYNNDGAASSFRAPDVGGGFGDGPSGAGGAPSEIAATFAPRIAPSGPEEVITVTTLTEMEGMFLFQHRNYQVTSARRGSKVIRRYSDFVWLLDCLHKRYPFRQLPLLPPKRVASKSSSFESHNAANIDQLMATT